MKKSRKRAWVPALLAAFCFYFLAQLAGVWLLLFPDTLGPTTSRALFSAMLVSFCVWAILAQVSIVIVARTGEKSALHNCVALTVSMAILAFALIWVLESS